MSTCRNEKAENYKRPSRSEYGGSENICSIVNFLLLGRGHRLLACLFAESVIAGP